MENAAKALQIAAGVLISVMILGIVVYQYNNMSELKKVQLSAEQEEQALDFNKGFEAFSRELYGTELIALANKVKHFNNTYLEDGYEEITLRVSNIDRTFFPHYWEVEHDPAHKDLAAVHQELEDLVKTEGQVMCPTADGDGKQHTYAQLYKTNDKTLKNMGYVGDKALNKQTWTYTRLLTEMQDFSREKFESVNWEYSNVTGRIIRIEFRRINV